MTIGTGGKYRGINTFTMTGTLTLVANDAYHQNLDPNGARTLVLPSGTATAGGEVMITNAADMAEAITVQQSDASTTLIVIDQDESALLVCNGLSAAAGWQAVGITEA